MSSPETFAAAATALAVDGWYLMADFLAPAQIDALAGECIAMQARHQLRPAGVGANHQLAFRDDHTGWIDWDHCTPAQRAFTQQMDALRQELGRQLMLSLEDSEAHYAVYAPGGGYARHLDRLRHSDARVVSTVLYLNHGWQPKEGGALRLYLGDGNHRDVYPHGGTLVMFLSSRFEHEVLPATRQRMSIACWMRQRVVV